MPCWCAVAHRPDVRPDRAELGVHGVVAALGGADRVRRAGIVRAGDERVVAALAVLAADRVDRQQVEDVEAEVGDRRDLLLDRLQAAPRAREQLVPGAEAGPHAVDLDRGLRSSGVAPWRSGGRAASPRTARAPSAASCCVGASRSARRASARSSPGPRRSRRALAASLEQHDALGELAREVVAAPASTLRRSSSRQVANRSVQASIVNSQRPARLDRELAVPADAVDVRVDRVHRRLEPAPRRRAPCSARRRAASRGRRGRCRP